MERRTSFLQETSVADIMELETANSRVDRLVASLCRNCLIIFVAPEERIIT